MDVGTLLFGLVNLAIVVYAFDRLGAMIPDSSWGGLYVAAERIWSWRVAGRSEERLAPPTVDTSIVDSRGEPVAVIEEISGSPSRWPW